MEYVIMKVKHFLVNQKEKTHVVFDDYEKMEWAIFDLDLEYDKYYESYSLSLAINDEGSVIVWDKGIEDLRGGMEIMRIMPGLNSRQKCDILKSLYEDLTFEAKGADSYSIVIGNSSIELSDDSEMGM